MSKTDNLPEPLTLERIKKLPYYERWRAMEGWHKYLKRARKTDRDCQRKIDRMVYYHKTKHKKVKDMDTVDLMMKYEEGKASKEEGLELFSRIIKDGSCWSLQGMYGRTAKRLIDGGIISKEGVIDWDKVHATGE